MAKNPISHKKRRDVYKRQVVHSPLIDISKSKLEEAIEKAQIFVETEVYEEAKKKLEYSRTLIISGDPGVGKLSLIHI